MKFRVVVTKEVQEVDVPLPLYRYLNTSSDHGDSEHFTKIDQTPEGLYIYEIGRRRQWGEEHWSWEFEVHRHRESRAPESDLEYAFGRGPHALTPERWETVRAEFQTWATKCSFITERSVDPC